MTPQVSRWLYLLIPSGAAKTMTTPLITTLRENCGYLQDEGWHQTARLMTLAASEIERLTVRIRELEAHLASFDGPPALPTPEASNQNGVHVATVASRR
jgi:hypothetical protein